MKANVGSKDKSIRLLLATFISVAVILDFIPSSFQNVALGIAIILLVTGIINFCPIYALLGQNTCSRK